jgi:hypothetical protein
LVEREGDDDAGHACLESRGAGACPAVMAHGRHTGEEPLNKQPELTEQTRANLLEAFWSPYAVRRIDQITVKENAAIRVSNAN